jgi:hypothetical protein
MPREPDHEIGELLRSHKPDPRPSPGLESRIVQSLRTPETSAAPARNWLWFLLPPAVAAAIVLMWPPPAPQAAISRLDPAAPASTAVSSAEPADTGMNPLERESEALRNDARRAGRFLINCLPGLAAPVK